MIFSNLLREKSSPRTNLVRSWRDEKNRQVCLIEKRQG